MNDKNKTKLESIKTFLNQQGIFYTEYPNGQLKVDGINLWATSEKWFDEKTGDKGVGVNSFITHFKNESK